MHGVRHRHNGKGKYKPCPRNGGRGSNTESLVFIFLIEYDVPLDRALGLNATYIDKPIEAAKALATTDIYDKTEEYEPRAEITNIDFKADYERGILKPIVEVEINGEYEKEEYTE